MRAHARCIQCIQLAEACHRRRVDPGTDVRHMHAHVHVHAHVDVHVHAARVYPMPSGRPHAAKASEDTGQ